LNSGASRDQPSSSNAAPSIATPSIATPSIAVLAFANRSASADDEYFSDGLADELLNVLARIKGLRVAARTSSFSFKGKQTTVAEIGNILNVATVLEGSVRKSGNRVRISVQLIKVDDGFQLWGETYDRTLDDIFAAQDDIAHSVVKELRATLLGESPAPEAKIAAEIAQATTTRSENPEALRLCMQARFLREKRTDTELQAAIALYEKAIALDPTYAAAYSGLARALDLFASYGTYVGRDPMPLWARAKEAARAAITHDPNNADAYLSLAHQATEIDRNMAEADRLIATAFELNSNSVEVYRSQASQHLRRRQFGEMRASLLKALALDPLAMMTRVNLVLWALAEHRSDEAEQMLNEVKQMNPG
jgi:TolB-like protein/Tfp pilus assembly protein PilF